jgi:hypothetical protein
VRLALHDSSTLESPVFPPLPLEGENSSVISYASDSCQVQSGGTSTPMAVERGLAPATAVRFDSRTSVEEKAMI